MHVDKSFDEITTNKFIIILLKKISNIDILRRSNRLTTIA